jgi:hypothetical protein
LTRTGPIHVPGRAFQLLAWRFAIGWHGPGGLGAVVLLPVALVERQQGRERRWLVPDLTLAVTALSAVLAAWIAFRPAGRRLSRDAEPENRRRKRG